MSEVRANKLTFYRKVPDRQQFLNWTSINLSKAKTFQTKIVFIFEKLKFLMSRRITFYPLTESQYFLLKLYQRNGRNWFFRLVGILSHQYKPVIISFILPFSIQQWEKFQKLIIFYFVVQMAILFSTQTTIPIFQRLYVSWIRIKWHVT